MYKDDSRLDSEIARDVAGVLTHRPDVPESVYARVKDGWLWLEGEVDWPFQRAMAERAVEESRARLQGLRGMTNEIVVARPATLPRILELGRVH